jgi:hypothetical protein
VIAPGAAGEAPSLPPVPDTVGELDTETIPSPGEPSPFLVGDEPAST